MTRKGLIFTLLLSCAAFSAQAQQATDAIAPEMATAPAASHEAFGDLGQAAQAALKAKAAGQPVKSANWMISAANPHAVEAGARVLEAGAAPPMPWSRCRPSLAWSNRKARALAAGPCWSGMTRPRVS